MRPDDWRVPRRGQPRRRRQPARDLRLPRGLLLAARAMAERRRRRGDPGRRLLLATGPAQVTRLVLFAVSAFAVLTVHSTPARVGVEATEFHLVLSRASVKAGPVVIELQNGGEDVHDLRLRRI